MLYMGGSRLTTMAASDVLPEDTRSDGGPDSDGRRQFGATVGDTLLPSSSYRDR